MEESPRKLKDKQKEQRDRAEAEKARLKAEEEARLRAEEEARRQAEAEEANRLAQEDKEDKLKEEAEEEARRQAEDEARRQADYEEYERQRQAYDYNTFGFVFENNEQRDNFLASFPDPDPNSQPTPPFQPGVDTPPDPQTTEDEARRQADYEEYERQRQAYDYNTFGFVFENNEQRDKFLARFPDPDPNSQPNPPFQPGGRHPPGPSNNRRRGSKTSRLRRIRETKTSI